MPDEALDALMGTVAKANDVRLSLEANGYEVLGIDGTTPTGEPIITISEPLPQQIRQLGAKLLWTIREEHIETERYIAWKDGCWIQFVVRFPKIECSRIH